MEILKNLIRVDALLLALFAWLEAFGTRSRASEDDPALSLLGTGLLVCAVLLLLVGDLLLVGSQRRLGRYLAAGNVIFSFMVMVSGSGQYSTDVILVLVLVSMLMAGALVWASLLPLKPEEAAAELSDLRIPDEVRQALLRQVGEAAAQEERNRLARDLHDSIKQQLFTINVGAATAQERWERDPKGAQTALVDVRRSAREAMVEMQAMLHQLRPQALTSTMGLIEALREQAEALGYRSGAQVTVELGPEIPDDRMPPGAQEALFRIAQEALANVARHARAETVRIWIGQDGGEAVLRVTDDGQGFDPNTVVPGMGLRNLRERAMALRGRVEIESMLGTGSIVMVRIPLLAPATSALEDQEDRYVSTPSSLWLVFVISLKPMMQTRAPDLSIPIEHTVIALVLLACAIGFRIWGMGLLRHPEPQRADLRFVDHRLAAVMFFAAAGQLSWSWVSYEGELREEDLYWRVGALFCIALFFFELVTFHRWSEPRRNWRRIMPSDHRAVFIIGVLIFCAGFAAAVTRTVRDPDPARIVMVSLAGACSLYLVSRQPRFGGAP